ncbi:MAG: hypothetical protein R3B41_03675 [Candidatus Doudnabacteria bacterium]
MDLSGFESNKRISGVDFGTAQDFIDRYLLEYQKLMLLWKN